MSKFFYPLLMFATASLAIALWRQQESSCHLLGPEDTPNGETSSSTPYDDPSAAQPGMPPINRPRGMLPGNYMPIGAPEMPSSSGRPDSWPGGPAPKITNHGSSSAEGVSISSMPPDRNARSTAPVRRDSNVTPTQYVAPPAGGAAQYPTTTAGPPVGPTPLPRYGPPSQGFNPGAGAAPPNYPTTGAPGTAPPAGRYPATPFGPQPPVSAPNTNFAPPTGAPPANYPIAQPLSQGQTRQTSAFGPQPAAATLPTENLLRDRDANFDIDSTRVIAVVGGEPILAYEVMVVVNDTLRNNAEKIPPDQLESIRDMLIKQKLRSIVESKLMLVDAKRKLPKEALPKIEAKLGEAFEEQEARKILKRANLKSRAEWDTKLREMGSSVEREKRDFIDRTLGQQWVHQQLKMDKEVTHQEMLDYYRDHSVDYDFPAQCRWEQISVRILKHPSKQAAYQKLAEMGNRVYGGAPLAEVAKAGSDGITAAKGGENDWTIKGSLASEPLDKALFSLPVGQLSPIIEDSRNLHIVRVLERKEAGRQSFVDVQSEIKAKIRQERISEQIRTIVARIRTETTVWTAYGDILGDEEEKQKSQAKAPRLSR